VLAGNADRGVGLVNGAVGLDADVVFGDTRTAEEAGFTIVARASVDL